MSIKLHGFTCGWITAPMAAFVEGEEGSITAPVPAYLIEHPKGRVVFDTGLPFGVTTDKEGLLGKFVAGIYEFDLAPAQMIDKRLESLGADPARIDTVVNSHLHFDHCGANELLPNARLVVQKREAEAARSAKPDGGFSSRAKIDDRDVQEIDGEHDLFGDGSVVLFPTYGHTPGHQSLKLACDDGTVVLAGDCCYFHRTLSDLKLPGFGHDRDAQREAVQRLRKMELEGARIIAGHDPAQWPDRASGDAPFRIA